MQCLNFFVCCFLVARIGGSNKEYWMCWCQACSNIDTASHVNAAGFILDKVVDLSNSASKNTIDT